MNSFPVADEQALRRIAGPLRIEAHLAPQDPRRSDLERRALSKLRRLMPDFEVTYVSESATGLFEQAREHYGEVRYALAGRAATSRATTVEGVLETIYTLSGATPGPGADRDAFRGHPLEADPRGRTGCSTERGRRWCWWPRSQAGGEDHEHATNGASRPCWWREPGSRRRAAEKVDLSGERVGSPPATFEPIVGTWVVAQDGPDKVVMVDGRPWVASKDNPTRLLVQSARRLYGTSNEELMDNAKQFAYYPVALPQERTDFSKGRSA